MKKEGIIFDMDGTLYHLDRGKSRAFAGSSFGNRIHANVIRFFRDRFKIGEQEALMKYQDIKTRFNGEVSLGLEQEFGIPRAEYFAATWNLDPREFVEPQRELFGVLSGISLNIGVLSAAPRIWIDRVLDFLAVKQLFEPAIFSGDPDIRKPNPQAFQQIADFWNVSANMVVSIGDQEETDIAPAKSLGMTTIRIGNKGVETAADFSTENVIAAIAILKEKGII